MNICKQQTFIGKKYLTFKRKYLRILFYIASCIYEAYSCPLWGAATRRTGICILAKFEGQKYTF